jgi:hypothetical protein
LAAEMGVRVRNETFFKKKKNWGFFWHPIFLAIDLAFWQKTNKQSGFKSSFPFLP